MLHTISWPFPPWHYDYAWWRKYHISQSCSADTQNTYLIKSLPYHFYYICIIRKSTWGLWIASITLFIISRATWILLTGFKCQNVSDIYGFNAARKQTFFKAKAQVSSILWILWTHNFRQIHYVNQREIRRGRWGERERAVLWLRPRTALLKQTESISNVSASIGGRIWFNSVQCSFTCI